MARRAILTAQQARACCECVHFVAKAGCAEGRGVCVRPGNRLRYHGDVGPLYGCERWEPVNPPEPVRWGRHALYPDGRWHRLPGVAG